MAELTAPEVVPKIIIRESLLATRRALGPGEAMAKGMIQKIDEGAWRGGLELVRQAPIESNTISQKLEQIGVTRDKTTGAKVRNDQERARYADGKTKADITKKFLEKGYDGMLPGEKNTLRKAVLAEAGLRPGVAAELNALAPDKQSAYAERILKDPNLSPEVRRIFEELLDPEKKLIDTEPTQELKVKADSDLEDAKAEKKDHDRLWSMNDKRLAEYEERTPAGGTAEKGPKLVQLDNMTKQIQIVQADLDGANQALENAQANVRGLQDELNVLQTSRIETGGARNAATVQEELAKMQLVEASARQRSSQTGEKLVQLQGEQQRLRDENEQLIERQKTLDTERHALERKIKNAEREVTKRQWEMQDQEAVRESQEQDLVNGFRNIFGEATNQLINAQVEQATQQFNTEIETLKRQTTDQNEKAMYDALQNRWLATTRTRMKGFIGFRHGETYRPLDRKKINTDFGNLMTGGPEKVMQELLMSRTNPATGEAYTDAEAKEILANKDYANKMQPEVVKQLLARKVLAGGISEEDTHILVNSQWGKDMIQGALEKNDQFRQAVEQLMGKGAVESKGFWGRFGENLGKNKLWWLALLGLIGLPIAAGVLSVKKESIAV